MINKENRLVPSKKIFNSSIFKEKRVINKIKVKLKNPFETSGDGVLNKIGSFFKTIFWDKPKEVIQKATDSFHDYPEDKWPEKTNESLDAGDMVAYYTILYEEWNNELTDVNHRIDPFESKLQELEEIENNIEEERLNKELLRRELEPELKNKKIVRKYYIGESATTDDMDKEIKGLSKKVSDSTNLPKLNPEVEDNLLGHGKIKISIYRRALKSRLEPLYREKKHCETQKARAKYWEGRERELEK